jgi:hypothetical protein
VVAQACLALDEPGDARESAERGLALAEPMAYGSIIWQLRRVRGLALRSLGDDQAGDVLATAESEFGILAARIADPELRGWFERLPSAPSN